MNNNTLTVKDNQLSYHTVRGKVLSTEKFSETETSLSGGFSFGVGRYYQQADTKTNMRSCVNHQIWLRTENGEDDFLFYDSDIPLKENHDVTITLVSANGKDYYPTGLANHSTGENYVAQSIHLERVLGLTYRAHRTIKILEYPYEKIACRANPFLDIVKSVLALWFLFTCFAAVPVGFFVAMKAGLSSVVASYILLSVIIIGIMLFRFNLGLSYIRDMRQEYRNKLLDIMDNLDGKSLTKTAIETSTVDTNKEVVDIAPQVESIDNTRSAVDEREESTANCTTSVLGSFVINTQVRNNFDIYSFIEKIMKIPESNAMVEAQTIPSDELSQIKKKSLIGIGLSLLGFVLLFFNFNFFVALLLIISGAVLQTLVALSIKNLSHSTEILKSVLIYNALLIIPMTTSSVLLRLPTFFFIIQSIVLIFYACKYYRELYILTKQKYFTTAFGVYAVSGVVKLLSLGLIYALPEPEQLYFSPFGSLIFKTHNFMFLGSICINIFSLVLAGIAWSKIEKINKSK